MRGRGYFVSVNATVEISQLGMKIAIDARLIEETGVGRYIRNLAGYLAELDTHNEYVVFLRKKSFDAFVLPNKRWTKRLADVPWHGLREQLVMPALLQKARVDLVHIPYHNPPIFYGGDMVITIHDLTILHFNTGKATTLPPFIYALKRFGYWLELSIGLRRARAIIAVSETTKQELMDHFGIPAEKIFVTYEGVDAKLEEKHAVVKSLRIPQAPYFLYVGNAYPHKNLDMLLDGFSQYTGKQMLVFVGKDDYFYRRLQDKVSQMGLTGRVKFFGGANDSELHGLYRNAQALLFPSLMEGFGLPALEALSLGTPVLCSDIPIFHEILGTHATYMDTTHASSIARALEKAASLSRPLPSSVKELFAVYNWKLMATQTQKIYESSTRL